MTSCTVLCWKRQFPPVGGAPVLPATSPDAFCPPPGPTTSWMRRGWGMAPGASDAQTDSNMNTAQRTNSFNTNMCAHKSYVWTRKHPLIKWWLTSDIADSEPPAWGNKRSAQSLEQTVSHKEHQAVCNIITPHICHTQTGGDIRRQNPKCFLSLSSFSFFAYLHETLFILLIPDKSFTPLTPKPEAAL